MKVFGIDIIKGSVRSRSRRPQYALIVREDREKTLETQVSFYRLIRRIRSESPDILAVDSIQEIATTQQDLVGFLNLLPPKTRLVQVTGGEKQDSLQVVAARYNLKCSNKFDPFAEARTIAHLAELGAGCEVIAFEDSSDIIVSRSRSLGKGGWSQNRYARKVHGEVRLKSREIERTLRESGLRYEKNEQKAFGGLGRVIFHVCAPRGGIPVRNTRGSDVQVNVQGLRLDRIRYQPMQAKAKSLILGVDPGTTIGLAALDLDGNLVDLKSSRQMSLKDVVEYILSLGQPVVVASDVAKMPASVEKIRRLFQAVAYSPKEDKTQEEKATLCGDFPYSNDHERDSLAAAVEAFRYFDNHFRNAVKRAPAGYNLDDIRAGLIRGQSLEQITGRSEEKFQAREDDAEPAGPITPADDRMLRLDGRVKKLTLHVHELEKNLAAKDHEIARLEGRISSERTQASQERRQSTDIVHRESKIKSLKKKLRKTERTNKKLVKQIDRLRRFSALQMDGDFVPVKVAPALTRESLRELDNDLGIGEGDVVYVARTDGWGMSSVEFLAGEEIKTLVTGTDDPDLVQTCLTLGFPCLPASAVHVMVRGKTGTVEHTALEQALEDWEEQKATYLQAKSHEMLDSIVKEYRYSREQEVRRHG